MKVTYEFSEPEEREERMIFEHAADYKDCVDDIDRSTNTAVRRLLALESCSDEELFDRLPDAYRELGDILTCYFNDVADILAGAQSISERIR